MGHDDPFDSGRVGYRVLGEEDAPGYSYSGGEPARMATGEGLITAPQPLFEFDTLDRVGGWLHLGTQVRRLRIPPDAVVVRQRPMSQGGCYTWKTDRVELLDVLPDYPALMREYDATGTPAEVLHFSRYLFPAGFRFPERVNRLVLRDSLAADPLDLPARLDCLRVFWSALSIGRVPVISGEFTAQDSYFEGVDLTAFDAAAVHASGCTFRSRSDPMRRRSVALLYPSGPTGWRRRG